MTGSAIVGKALFIVGIQFVLLIYFSRAEGFSSPSHGDGSAHQLVPLASSALSNSQSSQATSPPAQHKTSGPLEADLKSLQITYEDGQLTIVAENAPLSDVLSEIRKAMGADIDIPANAAAERIWVRFGPGPARSVLRDLLDGTDLDYVIQASDTDEDGVRSVSLTTRGKTDAALSGNQAVRATNRQSQPGGSGASENSSPDEHVASETIAAPEPETPVAPPSPAGARPAVANSIPARENAGLTPTAPMVGSSEQMAQQLQNLYQQRRQMQAQQNQKPPVAN